MIEVEWQFDAPDLDAVERWLLAQPSHGPLTFAPQGEKTQVDTYFDSADWAVYRAGLSLRVRRKPDGAEATLKALGRADSGLSRRREITQRLAEGVDDPREGRGEVADRLAALLGRRALEPVCEVTTRRRSIAVQQDGATLATLTLDEAKLPGDAPPLLRVEIEEHDAGSLARLDRFVGALIEAGGLTPSPLSKFESALRAAGRTPEAYDLGDATLDPEATAPVYAYAVLRRYFRDLLSKEPGTRLGEDIEELHDMRVATRRLRAALSTFEGVLPPAFGAIRDELRWLAAALGAVRDLDVQLEAFAEMQSDASWDESNALGPLISIARERHASARKLLLDALDSQRYERLVQDAIEALRAGPPEAEDGVEPVAVRAFASAALRRRFRQFRRDADELTEASPAAAFHEVRIRAKRLRYCTEVFTPLAERPARDLTEVLKAAQDVLGEHQDSDVAIAWLHEVMRERGASLPPSTLMLMGELAERHRAHMAECRAQWPRAYRRLEDRWRPFRRAVERRSGAKKADEQEAVPMVAALPDPDDAVEHPPPRPPRRPLSWFRRRGR